MHFSRLPFLPEIDVLKEDLSVINDTFKHLHMNEGENKNDYVEAYKYTFSRKGLYFQQKKTAFYTIEKYFKILFDNIQFQCILAFH